MTLVAANGNVRTGTVLTACVAGWDQSPFVRVNPNRSALVGRAPLLSLAPTLTLDFHTRTTTIVS